MSGLSRRSLVFGVHVLGPLIGITVGVSVVADIVTVPYGSCCKLGPLLLVAFKEGPSIWGPCIRAPFRDLGSQYHQLTSKVVCCRASTIANIVVPYR